MIKISKPQKKVQVLSRLLTIHALILGLDKTPTNLETIKLVAREIKGMRGRNEIREIMMDIYIPDKK